jgi:hypothetical protein
MSTKSGEDPAFRLLRCAYSAAKRGRKDFPAAAMAVVLMMKGLTASL